MSGDYTSGYTGQGYRSDCFVSLSLTPEESLDILAQSSEESKCTDNIVAIAKNVLEYFGVKGAKVVIKDHGAPDFVLAARMEACIKCAVHTKENYLLDMNPENTAGSDRKRIRMSRLYIPGNSPKMMLKAGSCHPHAVVLDLEDSVPYSRKIEARLLVRNVLRQNHFCGAERMVRINQIPMGLDDLEQIIPHLPHVIIIPKCESAEEIKQVNEKINQINQKERTNVDVFLIAIIESAKGVINAAEIVATADNIIAISIGLEDYTADLGVERTLEGAESFYARSYLVNVCKAHDKQALDSVFSDFGDMEGLKSTIIRSKSLGFEGMGCIHPQQIEFIHSGYAPAADEITKAKKIVMAYEDAKRSGIGAISLGSKMIDLPVVERANRIIERDNVLNRNRENERLKML